MAVRAQAGVSSRSKVVHRSHSITSSARWHRWRAGERTGEGRHAGDMLCVLAAHGLVDYSALLVEGIG